MNWKMEATYLIGTQFLISANPTRLQEMIRLCNLLSLVASMRGRFGGFLCLLNGYREGENHPPNTFKNICVWPYLLHCSRKMILKECVQSQFSAYTHEKLNQIFMHEFPLCISLEWSFLLVGSVISL